MHGAVTLELENQDVNAETLQHIPGVIRVETLPVTTGAAFRLYPKAGQALIHNVNETVCAKGWRVRVLTLERGRLDEVFRTLTTANIAIKQQRIAA
jgi:ABC-2 type transport system ATP-binding protein